MQQGNLNLLSVYRHELIAVSVVGVLTDLAYIPSPSNIFPTPPNTLPSSFRVNVPYANILDASLLMGNDCIQTKKIWQI